MSAKLNSWIPVTAWLLAGLFALSVLPVQAQDGSNGPTSEQELRAFLEKRDREIKTAIKPLINGTATAEQRQRAEDLINDPIDFEEMGRRALGPFWSDLTQEQRTAFIDLFETIVRSQSLADLDVYNSTVTYDEISVVGDSAYVKTYTTYKDKRATVEYILGWHDAAWWLYDIILDEVSTVEGYARSFQSVIRKKGFDALMNSLEKKRQKLEARS